jgi:hypothetical protein
MIGVDLIGQIRRAFFEQRRPIKEIVRTLSVSRATVRKVVRGQQTEFKYARGGRSDPNPVPDRAPCYLPAATALRPPGRC